MRKFKYEILSQITGEVTAKDIPDAIVKSIQEYYKNMQNPEVLDFQFMTIEVQEIT